MQYKGKIFTIICIGAGDVCPAACPVICSSDHFKCPGGPGPAGGCPMPDTCQKVSLGTDGAECPNVCPMTCPPDHMFCDGGLDANGCPLADTCVPNKGRWYFIW